MSHNQAAGCCSLFRCCMQLPQARHVLAIGLAMLVQLNYQHTNASGSMFCYGLPVPPPTPTNVELHPPSHKTSNQTISTDLQTPPLPQRAAPLSHTRPVCHAQCLGGWPQLACVLCVCWTSSMRGIARQQGMYVCVCFGGEVVNGGGGDIW